MRLWLNQAGAGYGSEIVLTQVPEYIAGETTLRLADMNGDGATDLLYSTYPAAAEDIFRYLDFTGGTPALLAARIENGLGRTITLSYRTSTDYYVDDWDAGQPWTLRSPVPVTVVSGARCTTPTAARLTSPTTPTATPTTTPTEKAFRGFALAQQIDRGDPTAPTQVQRIIFDTGATDRSRKGMILQPDILGEGGTCGADAPAAAVCCHNGIRILQRQSEARCLSRLAPSEAWQPRLLSPLNQSTATTRPDQRTDGRKVHVQRDRPDRRAGLRGDSQLPPQATDLRL